ncbi:uncharacterized protein [Dysidea avara]|uniref:uncharacterized protein n=1 Tax=Dysidea avara TaxID=196820 RepID=UPI00332FB83D
MWDSGVFLQQLPVVQFCYEILRSDPSRGSLSMARLVSHPEFNNKKKQTGGVKAIARIPENNKLSRDQKAANLNLKLIHRWKNGSCGCCSRECLHCANPEDTREHVIGTEIKSGNSKVAFVIKLDHFWRLVVMVFVETICQLVQELATTGGDAWHHMDYYRRYRKMFM